MAIDILEPCTLKPGLLRQFSHTADVGIIANNNKLASLFDHCLTGMLHIITDRNETEFCRLINSRSVRERENNHLEVVIDGMDLESLLVNYLTEVLYLFEAENLLVLNSEILSREDELINNKRLASRFWTMEYDPHIFGHPTEIKAVTYHMITVKKCGDDSWGARLIFDL